MTSTDVIMLEGMMEYGIDLSTATGIKVVLVSIYENIRNTILYSS